MDEELQSIVNFMLPEIEGKLNYSPSTFKLWFGDFKLISLDDEKAVFTTTTNLRRNILSTKYISYIKEALTNAVGFEVEIEIRSTQEKDRFADEEPSVKAPTAEDIEENKKREEKIKTILSDTSEEKKLLLDEYTFQNFIEGASNKFAKSACYAVANTLATDYNPLFIHGNSGLGKTHLLCAVINHMKIKYPRLKIVYKKCEDFLNEMIEALQNFTMQRFKEKYRGADVLLIDDIQFIAGKVSTQEEFFHTFNELFEHKKQIVMTADRPPSEMATLEDRLRSRFGAGIMIGIDPPDYETRLAITQKKAKQYRLELSEDCLVYIAKTFQDNVRRIEGALKKLRALHALGGVPLTKENVAKFLKDMSGDEKERSVTPALIIRNVCKYYGVEEDTLLGPQRGKGIMEPRQVAMYLIRKMLGVGFNELGKLMKRDHGTVCHGVKKVETALERKTGNLEEIIRDIRSNIESTPY